MDHQKRGKVPEKHLFLLIVYAKAFDCVDHNKLRKILKEMGKQWKQCQTLFWGAPKSLQMVIAAMKLKDTYPLEGQYDQPR